MKRKLIKIGNSTLLLSIPREWVIANNLTKGDEVEVLTDQDKLSVWCNSKIKKEKIILDVTKFKEMLPRLLYALYKGGIDELELRSNDPEFFEQIRSVVWKDTVGFEVIEQGDKFCKIVNVSGKMEDFPTILRRLFLVTLTISEETTYLLKKNGSMKNIIFLEQENNRMTSILIRAINKYGSYGFKKIGPLYYMIQELEKIADQYKYMALHFSENATRKQIKPELLQIMNESTSYLRQIYELFYSMNSSEVHNIKISRQKLIEKIKAQFSKKPTEDEIAVLHHNLNIITIAFDLISSILILKL